MASLPAARFVVPTSTWLIVTTTLCGLPVPVGNHPSGKLAPAIAPVPPSTVTTCGIPVGLKLETVAELQTVAVPHTAGPPPCSTRNGIGSITSSTSCTTSPVCVYRHSRKLDIGSTSATSSAAVDPSRKTLIL